MSQNAVVTGTLAITDAATGTTEASYDLSKVFGTLTNLAQEGWQRQILSSPTPVSIPLGGVTAIRGIAAYVESGVGSLIFSHDANIHGITGQAVMFFGAVTVPQLALSGTGPITVRYLVIG